ncbi:MAG: hypothetical protein DSY89_06335, partial [Deltaproteobacteria bacterium]
AYPGTDGPIPTPEYEAVREGIDDGRYAYLLETIIKKAKIDTDPKQRSLGRQAEKVYQGILTHSEITSLEEMDKNRKRMTDWILKLTPDAFSFSAMPDLTFNRYTNNSFAN